EETRATGGGNTGYRHRDETRRCNEPKSRAGHSPAFDPLPAPWQSQMEDRDKNVPGPSRARRRAVLRLFFGGGLRLTGNDEVLEFIVGCLRNNVLADELI